MAAPSRQKPLPRRFCPAVEGLEHLILPSVLTPLQIRTAYGLTQLQNASGSSGTNGAGQTIAIIDAYDLPSLHPASGQSDLQLFDSTYGLNDLTLGANFLIENQLGQGNLVNLPAKPTRGQGGAGATVETALDVEAAHAIAPGASIILFEANSLSFSDLMTAIDTARNTPGVVAISMSFGSTEFPGETAMDSHFVTPSGHIGGSGLPGGITFVASTGDDGAWLGTEWPSVVPTVLAVGATNLTVNANNSFNVETAWSSPVKGSGVTKSFGDPAGANDGGSTGGFSVYEAEPAYQNSVQTSGQRTTPDVSMVGDPSTGLEVIDQTDNGATPFTVGGTSASTPQWAALIALVDQYRAVTDDEGSLDGASQTLPALYALYQTNQADFHLTQSGYTGYTAGPYYNLATGLGSPVANLLIPDLAATQLPTGASPQFANSLVVGHIPNAEETPIIVGLPFPSVLPQSASVSPGPRLLPFTGPDPLNPARIRPGTELSARTLSDGAVNSARPLAGAARTEFAPPGIVGEDVPVQDAVQEGPVEENIVPVTPAESVTRSNSQAPPPDAPVEAWPHSALDASFAAIGGRTLAEPEPIDWSVSAKTVGEAESATLALALGLALADHGRRFGRAERVANDGNSRQPTPL